LARSLSSCVRGSDSREKGLRDALEEGRDRLIPALLATLGEAESAEDDPAVVLLPWFKKKPVEELVNLLSDPAARPSARARARAARALGEMRAAARPAIPALFALLSDDDPGVRHEAEQALDRIDPSSPVQRWAGLLMSPKAEDREIARKQLCRDFAVAVPTFVADLDQKNLAVALRALRAMSALGDCDEARAERPALLPSNGRNGEAESRALDLWKVGFSGRVDDAAVASLQAALDDEVTSVRCCAALALGCLGRRAASAEPALAGLARSGPPIVREAARLARLRVAGL
jgi:HEAT repeat protein